MSSNPEPNNFSRLLVTGLTLLLVATIYVLSDGKPPNIVSQRVSSLKQRYVRARRIARRRLWDKDTSDAGIPRNLIFTYRHNILDTKEPKILYDNVQHTIKTYAEAWGETDPNVIFLSDDKCANLVSKIMPLLSPHFWEEYRGGHRGDMCRIVALYNYGGYYFDVDIEVVDPVLPSPDISLVTIESPNRQRFFQSFLAAKKGHPAFHKVFNMMLEYYSRGQQDNPELMGELTRTLHLAYHSMPEEEREDTLILDEINLWGGFGQKMYPGCKSVEKCPHQFVVHNPVLPSSDISLITIESPNRKRFFHSFLAARKGHPAFHKTFNMMLEYYSRGQDNPELMGELTRTLHLAYHSMPEEEREDTLILDEINLWGGFGQTIYPGCKSVEKCPHQFVVHNPKENRIYFHSHLAEAGLFKNSTNIDAGLASQDVSGPKIPHNMIFTYKDNLFETKDPEILYNNVLHTIEAYSQAWGEPNPRIMFLTDYECGKIITEFTPELAPYFCNEPRGAFRGDICRVVALYIFGGYYFDVDIEVIEPVILSPNIAFSTVEVHNTFFQAFLAAQ
eukprot:CAMPEP_0172520656 /NCGR_PEP_ID=MMETSP1066-20121228/292129_1 /TAXON_ID=671091 /ORGANISM="Coscinodiscus wailesii, Strain CCMP2513" /LENGTH=560 /DNA_ID=CAMNT_0013303451 /DNA_START=77 /DNA_END=1755 /DNA_ORIENTATION=+